MVDHLTCYLGHDVGCSFRRDGQRTRVLLVVPIDGGLIVSTPTARLFRGQSKFTE